MKFSKALRHIDIGDFKKKHLQKESVKIKEQKITILIGTNNLHLIQILQLLTL